MPCCAVPGYRVYTAPRNVGYRCNINTPCVLCARDCLQYRHCRSMVVGGWRTPPRFPHESIRTPEQRIHSLSPGSVPKTPPACAARGCCWGTTHLGAHSNSCSLKICLDTESNFTTPSTLFAFLYVVVSFRSVGVVGRAWFYALTGWPMWASARWTTSKTTRRGRPPSSSTTSWGSRCVVCRQ